MSNNDRDWTVEFDDRNLFVVKGTDASDSELIQRCHLCARFQHTPLESAFVEDKRL